MRGEAEGLIEILSGLAASLPPKRPLDDAERAMLRVPMEETLYKYGMNVDPALSLAIAVSMIAFTRWREVRALESDRKAPLPAPPAEA